MFLHPSKTFFANKSGLWNLRFLKEIIEHNKSGKYDYAHFIWALTMIELWFDIFINKVEYGNIDFISTTDRK